VKWVIRSDGMAAAQAGGKNGSTRALLGADEPQPFRVLNPGGRASLLLVGDHAGAHVPRRLGDMGLPPADWSRHIALDLGIAPLAEALARRLDATAVIQPYSRLVIDCNRAPERADAVPEVSDGSVIPGNRNLSPEQRAARIAEVHAPYHSAIAGELACRDAAGESCIVVALHSFTPLLATAAGEPARPWHAGVLHGGGEESFARAVLAELRARVAAPVGDNQPYAMAGTDYTIPHHCFAAGRRYVELEIRQDLLTGGSMLARWCGVLAEALTAACSQV
jgi:predicted N-formylglutamate amidohydrolase